MIAIFCNFFDLTSGATVWNLVVLRLKCGSAGSKTKFGEQEGDGSFQQGQSGSVNSGGSREHPNSRSDIYARGTLKDQDTCRDLSGRSSIRAIETSLRGAELGSTQRAAERPLLPRCASAARRHGMDPSAAPTASIGAETACGNYGSVGAAAVACFGPLDIESTSFLVVSGTGDVERERLWNEYVERYHYLGYGVPLGPHIKYFVTVAGEPMACLSFAGAAWRVEARDRWIGWNGEQRERNLRYIVNNTRFVIFPWVQVRNVASRLRTLAAKRIGADWHRLYAYEPWLLETFVDAERYAGTCYRAANWLLVGYTKGRGKLDREFRANLSKKAVLVYPLTKNATRRLRS